MSVPDVSAFIVEDFARLDDISLRQRWRRLIGRPMPDGLGRALTLRVLAYQQQAQRYGDLDPVSRRALRVELGVVKQGSLPNDVAGVNAIASLDYQKSRRLQPGTMLTREHGGVLHRVMVTENGFDWHGRTYESLSQVAFAITGTRWNGPRFFGLRDKGERQEGRGSKVSGIGKPAALGGRLAASTSDAALHRATPL